MRDLQATYAELDIDARAWEARLGGAIIDFTRTERCDCPDVMWDPCGARWRPIRGRTLGGRVSAGGGAMRYGQVCVGSPDGQ